jgi:hypothetical protein
MEKNALPDSPLWKEFQKAARKKRQNPMRLLTDYMRECIEIWEDQKMDEEIQRDARRSGFREEEAVDIVRRHRLEKKGQRAAP